MTVKDVSTMTGISVQAVYKRLKAKGLNLDEIRSKETGHFSEEGEALVKTIFNLNSQPEQMFSTPVERLKTEVEKLKTELSTAKTRIEVLEAQVTLLENERDHLREAADRSQLLQLETLKKIPAALPAPEKKWRFPWFHRKE